MEKIIVTNKPKLIRWLSVDATDLLQHVQSKGIIKTEEYNDLMSVSSSRSIVINLLDLLIGKGESTCLTFLKLLKEDDVNESFPELREWIKTVDTSVNADMNGSPSLKPPGTRVTCKISAPKCSDVYTSTIADSSTGSIVLNATTVTLGRSDYQKAERDWGRRGIGDRSIQDCHKFLKANTSALVQNVKAIDPILDDLNLHKESTANVRAKTTDQDKMRKLLDCVNCESIAKKLVDALFEHEEDLMKEIMQWLYAR
ncbi:uncharacterized protein si:dkey-10c21.1 [Danio aesculapii]|uniref:uncharacterized protein si:dkey-10c21.1 n=1 Tax=Danio aesculapii TaxID=1142201 RepID=UPI0024C0BEFD|nr:uncharacterized protein si:dkey-10c21.1 [Danio aesculapii]